MFFFLYILHNDTEKDKVDTVFCKYPFPLSVNTLRKEDLFSFEKYTWSFIMQPTFFLYLGILLPLFGTVLGAAAVFVLKRNASSSLTPLLYGFAAGVMLAALVWSLLIPALEKSDSPFPAAAGLLSGIAFFLLCDALCQKSPKGKRKAVDRMFFAVTLHNLPEGMAVGVALAGAVMGTGVSLESALLLSLGIALQNIPEGAILSMPLGALEKSKTKAFGIGALSGVVEPLGALGALVLTATAQALLPFILSFAAGAMLYVIGDELIPCLGQDRQKSWGLMALGAGFCVMMLMDVIFS